MSAMSQDATSWRDLLDQLTLDDFKDLEAIEADLYDGRDTYAGETGLVYFPDPKLDRVLLDIARSRIGGRLAQDMHTDVPLPAWATDDYRADKWTYDATTDQFRRVIEGASQKHGPLDLSLAAWQQADGTISAAEVFVVLVGTGDLMARVDTTTGPLLAADLRAAADRLDRLSDVAGRIVG
jgi:hypothetical protein